MRSRTAPKLGGVAVILLLVTLASVGGPTAGAQERRVVVIGDSVILGAQSTITSSFSAKGWAVTFDAAVNRSTSAGLAAIESHRAELTDSLVVNLGANDAGDTASFRRKVKAILDATAQVPHVYWVTIREVRDYYGAANQVVRELAAGRPNVTVVDWHAATQGATDLTASDGLHLNGAGAVRMAQVVTDAVLFGALGGSVATTPVPATPPGPPAPSPPPSPSTTLVPPPATQPPPLAAPDPGTPGSVPVPAGTDAPGSVGADEQTRAREQMDQEHAVAHDPVGESAEPSDPRSPLLLVLSAGAAAVALSGSGLVLGGLVLSVVVLFRSATTTPPVQSPTHPAVRARRRSERIAAASGSQES